jgi:hypothetical protein
MGVALNSTIGACALLCLLTLAAATTISLHTPILTSRNMIVVLPAICVIAAELTSCLMRRWGIIVGTMWLVSWSAVGTRRCRRCTCQGALVNHGTERCISFGGLRTDHAVGAEVLRILKPLGIDSAVKALAAQTSQTSAAQRQLELALQQARFSAAHARRQYDAVDPATNPGPSCGLPM